MDKEKERESLILNTFRNSFKGPEKKRVRKGYLFGEPVQVQKDKPSVDEKLYILITELRILKKENAKLVYQ